MGRAGRTPNLVGTVKLTVSTTPHVVAYLRKLVQTGLYGKNEAEAAERLITHGIDSRLHTELKPLSTRELREIETKADD